MLHGLFLFVIRCVMSYDLFFVNVFALVSLCECVRLLKVCLCVIGDRLCDVVFIVFVFFVVCLLVLLLNSL